MPRKNLLAVLLKYLKCLLKVQRFLPLFFDLFRKGIFGKCMDWYTYWITQTLWAPSKVGPSASSPFFRHRAGRSLNPGRRWEKSRRGLTAPRYMLSGSRDQCLYFPNNQHTHTKSSCRSDYQIRRELSSHGRGQPRHRFSQEYKYSTVIEQECVCKERVKNSMRERLYDDLS